MDYGFGKWLIVILFGLSGLVAQGQTDELNKPINLALENQSLAEALSLIDAQTSLSFSYNPEKLPLRAQVTYFANSEPLAKVLDYLAGKYHLSYDLVEKQIVLLPEPDSPPLTYTISGFVIDEQNGESLIGATIRVDSLQIGAVANGYGYFSLTLPYGRHKISTSFLGFQSAVLSLDATADQSISFKLSQDVAELQEIVVQGIAPRNINLVQTGKVNITPKLVAETPAAFGELDVIKALQNIPGIDLQSDGSTFFYVRGGNKDQNLILIDDAPIYNPSHLLGFYSSIIPDAVNSIDVYKSDLPLSKGGRLSSVIDIKTKEGNKQHFSAWGNVGIVSTQLGIEGPFKKGSSSYILSGRLSRIKWIFKNQIKDLDQFQFYDLTGKVNFNLNDKNKLYFSFYAGDDRFLTEKTGLSWANINGSIRWNHLLNKNIFVNTTLYASNYEYLFHLDRDSGRQWRTRIGEFGVKTDFSYFINNQQELSFGVNITGRTINPGNLTGLDSIPADLLVSVKNNIETAGYIQHELKKGKWGLKYGLRSSLWSSVGEAFEFAFNENGLAIDTIDYKPGQIYNNYFQVEPRATLSYFFNKNTSFKVGYGRTVQNLHLMVNSISPFTSFEVWLPSGPNIKPQQADQITLGYDYFMPNLGISLAVETYYKLMYNQIDYSSHASTLLNPVIESELVFGTTKAYGIELLLKKEAGRIRGLLGYTLSKAVSQFNAINNGNSFNAYSDRPNHFSLNLNYDLGLRLTLGANFTYTSGLPFSSPTGFYKFNGSEVPIYERKNNDRFPDYHRLDISAKFMLNKHLDKRFKHSLTLSIYNLYGRKNPVFINFNKVPNDNNEFEIPANLLSANRVTTFTYLYTVTPSLSYQFRF